MLSYGMISALAYVFVASAGAELEMRAVVLTMLTMPRHCFRFRYATTWELQDDLLTARLLGRVSEAMPPVPSPAVHQRSGA